LGDLRLKLDEDTSGRADLADASDNDNDLHERRSVELDELLTDGGVVPSSEGDDTDGVEGMEEMAVLGRPLVEGGMLLWRLLSLLPEWFVRVEVGFEMLSEIDGA
jgi:hypothetical protein